MTLSVSQNEIPYLRTRVLQDGLEELMQIEDKATNTDNIDTDGGAIGNGGDGIVITPTDEGGDFVNQRFGLFVFTIVFAIALVIIFLILVREFYWDKYGVDICPGMVSPNRHRRRRRRREQQRRLQQQEQQQQSTSQEQQRSSRLSFLSSFVWPSRQNNNGSIHSTQINSDRAMAEQLQQRLDQEDREADKLAKRKERRAWYESYMKPYTMVAKSTDFFSTTDLDATTLTVHDLEGQSSSGHDSVISSTDKMSQQSLVRKMNSTASTEDDTMNNNDDDLDEMDEIDIEVGRQTSISTASSEEPISTGNGVNDNQSKPECIDSGHDDKNEEASEVEEEEEPEEEQDDDDENKYLRLPVVEDQTNGRCRVVDAHCAICFCTYEEGDEVVWSGLECKHAFHTECILQWLSKGKKRCPICRHWFVPGARIEDQKKELEERLRREAEQQAEAAAAPAPAATDNDGTDAAATETVDGDGDADPLPSPSASVSHEEVEFTSNSASPDIPISSKGSHDDNFNVNDETACMRRVENSTSTLDTLDQKGTDYDTEKKSTSHEQCVVDLEGGEQDNEESSLSASASSPSSSSSSQPCSPSFVSILSSSGGLSSPSISTSTSTSTPTSSSSPSSPVHILTHE